MLGHSACAPHVLNASVLGCPRILSLLVGICRSSFSRLDFCSRASSSLPSRSISISTLLKKYTCLTPMCRHGWRTTMLTRISPPTSPTVVMLQSLCTAPVEGPTTTSTRSSFFISLSPCSFCWTTCISSFKRRGNGWGTTSPSALQRSSGGV